MLYLPFIDVESTQVMAQYLLDGGFGVVDSTQLDLLYEALAPQAQQRLQKLEVGLEHHFFRPISTLASIRQVAAAAARRHP